MNHRSVLRGSLVAAFLLPLAACGGSSSGSTAGGQVGAAQFRILEASNGFGKLLPYRIPLADAQGMPTGTIIEIDEISDLTQNLTRTNPILAPVEWPLEAKLPNGEPGNHFIYARFTQPVRIDSVLSNAQSAGVDNNLTGNIQVVQVDPLTGATVQIAGRGFVGGQTFGAVDPQNPSQLQLEKWVELDAAGDPVALPIDGSLPGLGFPGTEGPGFAGDNQLVEADTFVFVADSDGDLSSHERFPTGAQIQMKITRGVLSQSGRPLFSEGVASSTVGEDEIGPEVLVAGETQTPVIVPGNGETNVDPSTSIEIHFSEPVQPLTLGDLDDGSTPSLSAAIQIQFGPQASKLDVPFTIRPLSVFDLTRYELDPIFAFPGSGPVLAGVSCGDFSVVDVIVNREQFADLSDPDEPNLNTLAPATQFQTGEGPGLVNAPVTPDSIYIGRGGAAPSISVIDLNGFGQGPGNPAYDQSDPVEEGNTNFPNNPNVATNGALMIPPLTPGTCTVDGGSRGVFSLAQDSSLSDRLITSPLIESIGDMALGHALDSTFNNGSPFGCQAGGGNICAATGRKLVDVARGQAGQIIPGNEAATTLFAVKTVAGAENPVSWAPHPNPPPLVFPPLCLSPLIGGEEPTAFLTSAVVSGVVLGPGLQNLLVPSARPQAQPEANLPPEGLIATQQYVYFQGPSPPQPVPQLCLPFMLRQQIGQFLYVVDRAASQVVVLNSNRFTVLDRISLPDPTSLAMSPNIDVLAVTNERADQVSFIDVDPGSATFHEVVKTTPVGRGPAGIAWTPDNEDILVTNRLENTLSVISAFNLEVRKVVRNQLRAPFEVAITPRQQGTIALQRNVYFAYILNGDGTVAIFESGPDGVNGWGFDDVIGTVPFTFANPKTIQPDVTTTDSRFWVVHENALDLETGQQTGQDGGAVSLVGQGSGTVGQVSLDPGQFGSPRIRDIQYRLFAAIGPEQLTGVPVDIAFDNLLNRGPIRNITNSRSASPSVEMNGKAILKTIPAAGVFSSSEPLFMFLAIPSSREGAGAVDVIELRAGFRRFDTNVFEPGIQSIPASNAQVVVDYFRQ